MTIDNILNLIGNVLVPLLAAFLVWKLGELSISRKIRGDAIRDLMTYRADLASADFRRSLNRVSVTFHDDDEVRKAIRNLYNDINNSQLAEQTKNRGIVSLIYMLCQKNGFKGLSEYDIDQAFPEAKQTPEQTTLLTTDKSAH